ncbi:DNA topoisomerase 2 [Lunasporangiospora selenospora]|uniref:DNA topoisomerase 2 n=1 Tax=Lunasporangiospora selenospora TaxID=979761 RepID=A0A9P6G108_9FUNG|nr:DNA topoisomerase 2 [Lunasporangiospora selenospora]
MSGSESDHYAMSQDDSDGYAPEIPKKAAKAKAPAPKKAAAPKKVANGKGKAPKAGAGAVATNSKKRKLINSDTEDDHDDNKDDSKDDSKDDNSDDVTPPPTKTKKAVEYNETRTIEEIYQKKTPLEHILLRPDTYIGTTEMNQQSLWVLDPDSTKFVNRQVNIVPGLYKIVDEIIVNAADNKIRDPSMDTVKIDIDREQGVISVYNNGKGIPVEIHKTEGCYVPELIFGHLLTSSNYDDSQKKVTGGRNGYGAKLCNIFSLEFIVETADKSNGLTYKQVFSNNMSKTGKPVIKPMKKGEEFTRITFKPDFGRFNMEAIDADLEALLKKRTYDMAGCVKGIKVFLNGERIKIKSFKEYIDMYIPEGESKPKLIYDSPSERWEVACIPSDGQFQQVSFVNSISTSKGGVHVDYIAGQIVKELVATVKKKSKSTNVKPFHIKSHLWVFVNCLIENPAFDSQTKENMTLKQSAFGSKCELSEKFIKDVLKSPIVEGIINWAAVKDTLMLKKSDGANRSRINVPKCADAHRAGPRGGRDCTLILTEGDSAKALVMSGFGVIGRDYFGVFPLRGKMLNVRDTATSTVINNEEIKNLKTILGLKQGQEYNTVDGLRYGHLMIMTDQDHDGSHIKGLVINFLDHFYPSLLKIPGFLCEFITPIVKATKGREVHSFFTLPEYESWKEAEDGARGWKIKYYKGLGTSTKQDAVDYFSQMGYHKKDFLPMTNEERTLVDMAFNKKKADERKDWLSNFQPGTFLDNRMEKIPIDDFINKELILFSMADNIRSIPSVVDGLKPGQRKVIFGAFKKKIVSEIKVAQLAGYVSEKAAYHHGEQSLTMTIVGLAQTFVGSNNVNLLSPNGQFGSRMAGGKDAASARYIFTALPPITRRIFQAHDDALLNYLNDDGDWIEPEYYVPVLPMVLVNGSDGIGTGWSSSIPNYNPMDIIANIRRLMNDEEQMPMTPWYRGFTGTVERESEFKYKVSGLVEELDDTTVKISELPVRTWTSPYCEQIEQWISGTEKVPSWVRDYRDDGTISRIELTVNLTADNMRKAREEGLDKKFKLVSTIATSNMVCFDPQGRIKKYPSAEAIVQEFYDVRIDFYRKRKDFMIGLFTKQWMRLDNKVRFILMIISGELQVQNRKKAVVVDDLHVKNFTPAWDLDSEHSADDVSADQMAKARVDKGNEFDYLLRLPIWNLTFEKVEELKKERDHKSQELKVLIDKTVYDLWNEDLDGFVAAWEQLLEDDIAEANYAGAGKKKKGAIGRKTGSRVKNGDDEDFEVKKPKRVTAPKKAVKSEAGVTETKSKIKAEVKTEEARDIASFFKKTAPTSASSTESTPAISSGPKKQQSLLEMMKAKPTLTGGESAIKDEFDSLDDSPFMIRPEAQKAKGGRSKKRIDEGDSDEGSDSNEFVLKRLPRNDNDDDDDVMMEDVEIAPRQPSTRAPRAARAKRPVIVDRDSDFEMDDEDDFLPSPRKSTGSGPTTPRKMTKTFDLEELSGGTKAAKPMSEDEDILPRVRAAPKPKAKYSRARTIASDSEGGDDPSAGDADDVYDDEDDEDDGENDDDEDDYVEAKKGKKKAAPEKKAPARKAQTKSESNSGTRTKPVSATVAAKKLFSLTADEEADSHDEPMEVETPTEDTPLNKGDDEESIVEEAMDTSFGDSNAAAEISSGSISTATGKDHDDDDAMFSIMVPSKASVVKKRVPVPARSTKDVGGGGGSMAGGGSGSLSSSTSATSTGALAGAKTLDSTATQPPKAMSASSLLLAELTDKSLLSSGNQKRSATKKKMKYVDISDDD